MIGHGTPIAFLPIPKESLTSKKGLYPRRPGWGPKNLKTADDVLVRAGEVKRARFRAGPVFESNPLLRRVRRLESEHAGGISPYKSRYPLYCSRYAPIM